MPNSLTDFCLFKLKFSEPHQEFDEFIADEENFRVVITRTLQTYVSRNKKPVNRRNVDHFSVHDSGFLTKHVDCNAVDVGVMRANREYDEYFVQNLIVAKHDVATLFVFVLLLD